MELGPGFWISWLTVVILGCSAVASIWLSRASLKQAQENLEEVKAQRLDAVKPRLRLLHRDEHIMLFRTGLSAAKGIPKEAYDALTRTLDANTLIPTHDGFWNDVRNYGRGIAFDVSLTFLIQRAEYKSETVTVDRTSIGMFPWSPECNRGTPWPERLEADNKADLLTMPAPLFHPTKGNPKRVEFIVCLCCLDIERTRHYTFERCSLTWLRPDETKTGPDGTPGQLWAFQCAEELTEAYMKKYVKRTYKWEWAELENHIWPSPLL